MNKNLNRNISNKNRKMRQHQQYDFVLEKSVNLKPTALLIIQQQENIILIIWSVLVE